MNVGAAADGLRPFDLVVTAIEVAGADIRLYRLARADLGTLPSVTPGSHITLVLPNGLERQYSLVHTDPAPSSYAIAVKREPDGRGGSAFLHDRLRTGDVLAVRPPRNLFPLSEEAGCSVLIGGGIGVTPLIAMAEYLARRHRPFVLHAAFRSRGDIVLPRELATLPGLSLHLDDEAGRLFPMAAHIAAAPREAHLYCCGPAPMIDAFFAAATADGRSEDRIHTEYFTATDVPARDGQFSIELARSGLTLVVPPGKSILHVCEEAGISVLSSCGEGICGVCEVKVLSGIPEHHDAVLSPAERRENGSIMICCSGSLTDRLVLDL